ncbi:MAG: periplasmic heavy metal sensor [Candidatus Moduliflexus flocculans]|nr:periplasmic heavy metal sensor [Candidatus Moduliflexus flocculans]
MLLIVVNVSALLTFAYNRWVREPGGPRPARSVLADAFSRELCLSGTQEKCIKDFRFAFDSEIGGIQAQLREKRLAMVEELKKGSPDGATLDKLIEDTSRLQAEIEKKAVENLLKEKEVLTDEQRATFFRLFEEHVCPREQGAGRNSAGAGQAGCPQDFER